MFGTTSEHALRALAHMASLPQGAVILGRDLAQSARIPANYLAKILWSLRNAGVIDATRGSGGGYRLRKPPAEIRLIDVVDLFDHARTQFGCLLGGRDCSDQEPCAAHLAWREVREAQVRFLCSTTIADIITHANGEGKPRRKGKSR